MALTEIDIPLGQFVCLDLPDGRAVTIQVFGHHKEAGRTELHIDAPGLMVLREEIVGRRKDTPKGRKAG